MLDGLYSIVNIAAGISPNVYNGNKPAVMGLWWTKGNYFLQSITKIQIFAIQKVGICSDISPYQLFRYDIIAKSFSCAMLEDSLLDTNEVINDKG